MPKVLIIFSARTGVHRRRYYADPWEDEEKLFSLVKNLDIKTGEDCITVNSNAPHLMDHDTAQSHIARHLDIDVSEIRPTFIHLVHPESGDLVQTQLGDYAIDSHPNYLVLPA